MQKISKLTLTATNGVFKNLIQKIINNKELEKFKIIFSANIAETQIIITKKGRKELSSDHWSDLLEFLEKKTSGLIFTQMTE